MIIDFVWIALLFFISQKELRQDKEVSTSPITFRSPLNIPLSLSANFGEVRKDHYHMGLDIRTNQKENLPVYAVADGYVSRIKVEAGGYGNAIFITHPNGQVSLYAHLNSFYAALAGYVKNKQYQEESWEQDFNLSENELPVKKGQFIAWSGNTGASAGPHLHFEIRDTKTGNNINPSLVGFTIADRIPPTIFALYWYDRRYSTYDVSPKSIPVKKVNNIYRADKVIKTTSPIISLGIRAKDKSSSSPFFLGIYKAAIYMDGQLKGSFTLDSISYDETRYVNAGIDYKNWAETKAIIQHLSKIPGNNLKAFNTSTGILDLSDNAVHTIKIVTADIAGNTNEVTLQLQYDVAKDESYLFTTDRVKLIPNRSNNYETENVKVSFKETSFYDTVAFAIREIAISEEPAASISAEIGNTNIPVHTPYTLQMKMLDNLQNQKDKIVLLFNSNGSETVMKGIWNGDWMETKVNRFGTARLVVDDEAPTINTLGWSNGKTFYDNQVLSVNGSDNFKAIKNFRAELDGKWILFVRKGNTFSYKMDAYCSEGEHQLKLSIEDIAGNRTEQVYYFTKSEKTILEKSSGSVKKSLLKN